MANEAEGQPRNITGMDYSTINHSYANQSSLQLSSEDISMQFGVTSVDENGEPYIKIENLISMSYNHFEKFVDNCNNALKSLKEQNAK